MLATSSTCELSSVRLLDLPSELFNVIFAEACESSNGVVPFSSWRLACVCRRFRDALYSSVRRVSLASCFDPHISMSRQRLASIPSDVLSGSLLRCTELQELDISGCDALSDAELIRFLRVAPALHAFTAVICMRQTDALISALATTSRSKLTSIDLSGCDRYRHGSMQRRTRTRAPYRPCRSLSDTSLMQLAAQCTRLRNVSLCNSVGVTDAGLSALANLPLLENITLRRLTDITDEGVALLANGRGKLKSFHLLSSGSITDIGIIAISTGVATRELKSISISFNYNISDNAVRSLLDHVPLEELRCDHCALLSESWTINLEATFESLRKVSLRGVSLDISPRGIRNLAKVSKLREINLGFVASVNEKVLLELKQSAPELNVLILEACSKVDDAAAEVLADFPGLHTLDVSWCSRLSATGLAYIVEGNTGKNLREFHLGPVNGPGADAVLRDVARLCKNLELLVLSGEVEDRTLEWLKKNSSAEVEYADVLFKNSKRRPSLPISSGISD